MAELDLDLDLLSNLEADRLLLNNSYSTEESNLLTSDEIERMLKSSPPNPNQQPPTYPARQPGSNSDYSKEPPQMQKYVIKKKIGSGNFAVVRLGEHTQTKAKVSLIIIN